MPRDAPTTTSVVVPTRNRGELVLAAVASALDAGAADEVIVVDGGSTDGSLEDLRGLGGRIRLVEGRYANAAATRNAGARVARGRFLAFLDSDDLMLPEKVTCLAPLLESDESIALAHGRTNVIDQHGNADPVATSRRRRRLDEGERRGTSYAALAEYCEMFTSATLLRKAAFEEVGGYDESLDAYEDWDLYLRLSLRFGLVYAQCVTAAYRVWPGNVAWHRTAAWTARVAEKHLSTLPDLPEDEAQLARYAFLRRIATANHILVHTRESRRAALAAIRTSPARALLDRDIRAPLLRSFVPAVLLRRRRPPL